MTRNTIGTLWFVGLVIFVLLIIWNFVQMQIDCEAKGGTLVKGLTYECVKLERIR